MQTDGRPASYFDIWSIPSGKFRWYLTLLLTSGTAVCGYLIYGDVGNPEYVTGQMLVRAILTNIIISYTGAAIGSVVLIQWSEMIMVLVHFLREQTRKLQEQRKERERLMEETRAQGRAEGHAEGSSQTHAQWESWNQRRIAAERGGQSFDEPPPMLG